MKKVMYVVYVMALSSVLNAQQEQVSNTVAQKAAYVQQRQEKVSEPKVPRTCPEISSKDLLQCISHCRDVMVVNVLGRRFWEDARIKGSICAPLKELEQTAKQWDKSQKIVVYCACQQCDASQKAYDLLKKMGFKRVLAYEGGIREWYNLKYPCEGPCEYEYLIRTDDYQGEEKQPLQSNQC